MSTNKTIIKDNEQMLYAVPDSINNKTFKWINETSFKYICEGKTVYGEVVNAKTLKQGDIYIMFNGIRFSGARKLIKTYPEEEISRVHDIWGIAVEGIDKIGFTHTEYSGSNPTYNVMKITKVEY